MNRPRIHVAQPWLAGNEKKYVNECLDSGWIAAGRFVAEFEERFAEFCGVKHAICCANGTSALHAALLALGVGPGGEVLVPTLTYVSTANAVHYCGATPVFVDSEPLTMNIDPARVEAKITARTKGIIPVHLYGHPVDMLPIKDAMARRGLFVLEDAAEAHGAEYRGERAGSLATASIFSFYGNKIITTGEGGMVTTSDSQLASRVRMIAGQGMDPERRYWFPMVGNNFRMTNLQAAIGVAQLEQIDLHLAKRRQVAGWYRKHLSGLQDMITLPGEAPWAKHSFWMYTILLSENYPLSRDEFMEELDRSGIETRPVFYPMHVMPPYREPNGKYPVAESLSKHGVNLPTHGMLTEEDIFFIAACIRETCVRRPVAVASLS
ncbi:MAG: DegT/DnrJ/EryC1/StrS family aminotransferase [Bryobacteraceae bacterium]|jgi:perosamine synthetase